RLSQAPLVITVNATLQPEHKVPEQEQLMTAGCVCFALLQAAGAQVITVDDTAVVQAMRLLWQVLKQVVEPSSAIALAAVLADPARFAGKRVGVILSGGNVD
ncbi:pyridoxal-phosphate dependent enzyme, partial [Pseudomonas viridiflava]|uniref:pyridoxal-phosphate dependent enzyme n=1 Tax=Pseudomonas viridiflava TaxID=33069 RepID=UPI00197FE5E4